jgi:hypothetical protein
MVGLGRLELPTSRLSGVRSNQLSYRPGSRLPENHIPVIFGRSYLQTSEWKGYEDGGPVSSIGSFKRYARIILRKENIQAP